MHVAVTEVDEIACLPPVRGFLHTPDQKNGDGLVLTHGAGANCNSKLLNALAAAFAEAGYVVLRCNLPFRQERPHGPPSPAIAERDRSGLRRAVEFIRARCGGRIFLGGHSYGGRQATILAAEEPEIASALVLFSYPLHPPRKPLQLRTAHLPNLRTPSFFVHGTRDPFGSLEEMQSALELIPAKHELLAAEGAGHEILGRKTAEDFILAVVGRFQGFAN
ncbi:MAG TPA: alpha/beta fold hydrolase [Candidatus Limnocylindrales bacterium]|jgi:predicted alpha/beta-hydrolase family hydrolase|nr:alpha/beta fold hydrolase [Candidatus Limnocylindrales bacterium]